jgi:hypothetical protein
LGNIRRCRILWSFGLVNRGVTQPSPLHISAHISDRSGLHTGSNLRTSSLHRTGEDYGSYKSSPLQQSYKFFTGPPHSTEISFSSSENCYISCLFGFPGQTNKHSSTPPLLFQISAYQWSASWRVEQCSFPSELNN